MSATGASAAAGVTNEPPVAALWVGSKGGMEQALVQRAGLDYAGISTGQLRVKNPVKVFASVGKMSKGVRESQAIIDRFRPDVCFVTGGYVCGPVVVACALRKVPVLIYLPDMTPGYAIRWLSKLAQRVAVSFPEVARFFGAKAVVTGYPVRQELVDAAQDRRGSRRKLAQALGVSFDEPDGAQLPLLLVWGGSSGSRAINQATWSALEQILPYGQVLHVVGTRDWPLFEAWQQEQTLSTKLAQRYHPVAYLHDAMPLALAGADLTVARAGASTLGEFPVARLPSILAPLHSVNQLDNAQVLANRGAAVIVEGVDLPQQLGPTVAALLQDAGRRSQMEAALATVAVPDAAARIAAELVKLAGQGGRA